MKKSLLFYFFIGTVFWATAQDTCNNAEIITTGIYTVDIIDGTEVAPINCVGSYDNGDKAEWYAYIPDQNYTMVLTTDLTQNNGGDTRFNVYSGSCENLICIGGDDDSGNGYLSTFIFNAIAGETYYFVFDDHWRDDGFDFELTENEFVEPLLSFTSQPLANVNWDVGVADMNGDFLDDVISIGNTSIQILYQDASGTFVDANIPCETPENNPSWSLAIADYDANGYNDLLYGGGSGVTFMRANDDGTNYAQISGDEYVFSQRSNFVDINNDGNLDAFVCHDVEPNVFYMNDGVGNLTFNQGGLGDSASGGNYGSIWIDYDNDGDSDLFIAKCRGGNNDIKINQLHQNNGDGTFTEIASEAGLADAVQTWSSAWGDFDNDGFMDVFVGASSFADGHHKLMRNNGDGTFSDITAGSGFDTIQNTGRENVTYDFNNDGYLDIYGAGGVIMMNNGDLTFTNSEISISNGPVGDLNNDGFVDIASPGTVHLNQPNANNWLKVGVIGVESNINGIGARVEVYSNLGTQIRDVKSGSGFEFMNTLNCYFGIGEDIEIETVIIRWPSGIVDQIDNPEINNTLIVEEGASLLGVDRVAFKNFSLYPVPAEDELNLKAEFQLAGEYYEIYALTGKKVMNGNVNTNQQIKVNSLSSGMYFLKLTKNGKTFQRKFVKR